jgi:DMSO/TMAO reductase YedYZ molybdopterin-dependent catalytic subunit
MLATEMNDLSLTRDHGVPIRLLVPGWYGCACIKWVNNVSLVDETTEATSQMQEYAARTFQDGVPRLAKEISPR